MSIFRTFGDFQSTRREMERLRREMNRLFADSPSNVGTAGYPAMNVWTNEDGAVVTAELSGIDPDNLDISVVGDTLTLSGNREPDSIEENATYHRRERGSGKFTRSFRLPFQVDAQAVEATFKNGVLDITLPRTEADKPKKIAVKAA